jgi:Ca-activated chloride channel homolog
MVFADMNSFWRIIENRSRSGFLTLLFFCVPLLIEAQSDKKFIRQGNKEFEKSSYSESEISYRKAYDKNNQMSDAIFNIGDALYKQNKYEEAAKQFSDNIDRNDDKRKKSDGYYNLGNSMLKSNKIQESIEAYKNSLKMRPGNEDAKYNLAYAQDLLKKQQQQQQQQQDKDNKDKQDNKDNKDNKDQKKDDKNKDQNQDKKDQSQDQNKADQQQQQQQGMSKEDAQRLLNALANDEKKVQEKVKLAKAEKAKVRTVKNW